jgi:hypothetical protein
MFIEDRNKEQRLKNRRALESERTEKINTLFDVIHEHITELYEQVMDGEIEIEQVTEEIKKRL